MVDSDSVSGRERETELVDVHDYDDLTVDVEGLVWPVEVPPFRDERFRSLWHRIQYIALRASQRSTLALPLALQKGVTGLVAGTGRLLDRRHREAARDFIRTALPDATPEEVTRLDKLAWRHLVRVCLLYTSPSPRDQRGSRMPSSA